MAHMNQEKKAKIASLLKPILAKYGIKATLSVRNHMTICLNIKSGSIDFIYNYTSWNRLVTVEPAKRMSDEHYYHVYEKRYINVNPYHYQNHFSGAAKSFLTQAMKALKGANWYDKSDIQSDYFDTAYYVDINIGQWNKPYEVLK
jgi:hypothetical protein